MPEVSRFYGIIIKMFFNDHSPSHFHAEVDSTSQPPRKAPSNLFDHVIISGIGGDGVVVKALMDSACRELGSNPDPPARRIGTLLLTRTFRT